MFILDAIRNFFKTRGEEGKRNWRKFVLAAPFWVIVIALVLLGIGITRSIILTNDRYDTRMNTVWAQDAENKYRHIAVYANGNRPNGATGVMTYIDPEHSLRMQDITLIRASLQSAVDTGNTNPANTGLNRDGTPRNWEDCWSTMLEGTVSIEKEGYSQPITSDCEFVAVGGNFRAFHPFMYMSGGFLPEVCVDTKQIVINDVLAWKLYSSYDVVGNTMIIWDEIYTIAGVVAEPDSKIDRQAGTNVPRVYMYYNNLATVNMSGEEGGNTNEIAIMCYEAMLPEQVSGVAITDVKTALPNYSAEDPQMDVVSVTGRLNFIKVYQYIMPIGSDHGLEGYDYPYWEQASTITVTHLFAAMVMIALGALMMLIGIVMTVLKLRKFTAADVAPEVEEDEE